MSKPTIVIGKPNGDRLEVTDHADSSGEIVLDFYAAGSPKKHTETLTVSGSSSYLQFQTALVLMYGLGSHRVSYFRYPTFHGYVGLQWAEPGIEEIEIVCICPTSDQKAYIVRGTKDGPIEDLVSMFTTTLVKRAQTVVGTLY